MFSYHAWGILPSFYTIEDKTSLESLCIASKFLSYRPVFKMAYTDDSVVQIKREWSVTMNLRFKLHWAARMNQLAKSWSGLSFSSWLQIQSYYFQYINEKCFVNRGPGKVVYLFSICEEPICINNCGFKGDLSGTWYLLGKFCVQRKFHLHSSKSKKNNKKNRFFMFCIGVISMFFADFWWTLVYTLM